MSFLDSQAGAVFYIGTKLLAYVGWMYLGLRTLRSAAAVNAGAPSLNEARPSLWYAIFLGILRLFLGFIFALMIYFLSSALLSRLGYGLAPNILTYLSVYVPVRWFEWSLMAALLMSPPFPQFILGTAKADRLWRLGGILISCLADVPLIISLGGVIPTGRFLC